MSRTIIEVKRGATENSASLLRRFNRRVQESNVVGNIKSRRYAVRTTSKLSLKEGALKRITKRTEMDRLRKLGKIAEKKQR